MTAETALLVRADDAGSSWAANIGCLRACTDGIARSVEVMMPGAWVPQAARLFGDRPEIDIGLHLTLTSEWDAVKWRPLTTAPSLVDADGYFLPLLTARPRAGRPSLAERDWSLDEIAQELRAQVTLGKRLFPQASHVSTHMARHLGQIDPRLGDLVSELCDEFGLMDDPFGHGLRRFQGYPPHPRDTTRRVSAFRDGLAALPPGLHIFIDHPALASDELAALGHAGYEDVAQDRVSCLETLTNPTVSQTIRDLGIELVSYRDLRGDGRWRVQENT
ncbi:MAG: ChbG/HpnK family deacetylase [Pseudomonadota bacterium]